MFCFGFAYGGAERAASRWRSPQRRRYTWSLRSVVKLGSWVVGERSSSTRCASRGTNTGSTGSKRAVVRRCSAKPSPTSPIAASRSNVSTTDVSRWPHSRAAAATMSPRSPAPPRPATEHGIAEPPHAVKAPLPVVDRRPYSILGEAAGREELAGSRTRLAHEPDDHVGRRHPERWATCRRHLGRKQRVERELCALDAARVGVAFVVTLRARSGLRKHGVDSGPAPRSSCGTYGSAHQGATERR